MPLPTAVSYTHLDVYKRQFYTNKDLQKLEKCMQGKPVAEQEIGKQLLLETAAYAESSVCRRKTLLHYVGEEYTEENCGKCDNCLNPKKQVEAQELLCTVIFFYIFFAEVMKQCFSAAYGRFGIRSSCLLYTSSLDKPAGSTDCKSSR